MSRNTGSFVVLNLRETYPEVGKYDFKIVLSPRNFKTSQAAQFSLRDSDGVAIEHELRKWGRKMSCTFVIDGRVADGVACASFTVPDVKGRPFVGNLSFWVIK